MSKLLLQQLRKQRELKIPLDDRLSVTGRRPTDLQMTELQRDGRFGDLGQKYVIGWDGFIEDDLVGGGGTDVVAFDADLWADFYADHPEHWEKIALAILDAYQAHAKATEDAVKNSQPG
jgi:hypothetical protein